MPASISHEGYSAKPMHSYWDDFWALAGYESAIRIARALGHKTEMHALHRVARPVPPRSVRSLGVAMQAHGIDYLPGAAELGDFDATSTSIALSPVGEQQMLPPEALVATFERYWKDFAARRTDKSWDAYTPYEWRNLGTFIRLRWRDRGMELIEFLMNDRRPHEWNQWAEVVGREVRKSRFVGDMPHGWVASDYGRSLLDMFAFERPADETLVLMAGVPKAWTQHEGFAVKNLRTPFGPLSYSLRVEDKQVVLDIAEIKHAAGWALRRVAGRRAARAAIDSAGPGAVDRHANCASGSCRSRSRSRAERALNERRARRARRRSTRSRANRNERSPSACARASGSRRGRGRSAW